MSAIASTGIRINTAPYKRAFMGEVVFSGDMKTVLATDGLRSCIGFAGWDSNRKIGFLAHFSGPKQVKDFCQNASEILLQMSDGKDCQFSCTVVGGSEKTTASAQIVEALKTVDLCNRYLRFAIVNVEKFSKGYELRSLSLDTRDGTFGTYDVSLDPDPRVLTAEEQGRFQAFDCMEKLVYIP